MGLRGKVGRRGGDTVLAGRADKLLKHDDRTGESKKPLAGVPPTESFNKMKSLDVQLLSRTGAKQDAKKLVRQRTKLE